jgi:hypothetical protein
MVAVASTEHDSGLQVSAVTGGGEVEDPPGGAASFLARR